MERPVEADFGQVETHDPVERGDCFGLQRLEHASCDPLVASGPQRRVRHLVFEDRFDIDPRRAGHEPDQDPPETQPVRDAGPVTPQRMGLHRGREQRLHRPPKNIHNFGLERAHDGQDLHLVVLLVAPEIQIGTT